MKPLLSLGVLGFLVGVGLCVAGLSQGGLCLVSAILVVLGEVLPARRDEKELTAYRQEVNALGAEVASWQEKVAKLEQTELVQLKAAFLTLEQRQKAVLDRNGF